MNKTLCNFICCFIPKKKNRHHFRKKYLKNTKDNILEALQKTNEEITTLKQVLSIAVDVTKLPPATGNLKMIQDSSLALLNYFDKICKKYNLTYWIDSGTLIGYVRHNGFIPWDDDIDICMMREDYEKLPNILDSEFKREGFFWRDGEIIQLFFKDCPAQIDIFPMDSGNKINPPKDAEYDKFLSCLNEIKSHMDFDHEKWQKRECPVSDKYLTYCFKMRDTKLVPNKIKNGFIFYGVETGVKNRCCYSYTDIFPLKEINFYGIQTYQPNNTPYYLFLQYGDYMVLPKNYSSNHGESLALHISKENFKDCQELIEKYYPKEQ